MLISGDIQSSVKQGNATSAKLTYVDAESDSSLRGRLRAGSVAGLVVGALFQKQQQAGVI